MSKKKQISIRSDKLLRQVDKVLGELEKARKHAKRLAKHEKRAISAILEVEALLEDAKQCNCKTAKEIKTELKKAIEPKKSTYNKNKTTKSKVKEAKTKEPKVEMITTSTADDLSEPLLSFTSLGNTLDAPREGKADELHLISGVGPKLEELLHGLGVFHFDQIAEWTEAEVNWVDDYLQFTGRIVRDNWIEQAKALAKGGREEYVKVFGKEPR